MSRRHRNVRRRRPSAPLLTDVDTECPALVHPTSLNTVTDLFLPQILFGVFTVFTWHWLVSGLVTWPTARAWSHLGNRRARLGSGCSFKIFHWKKVGWFRFIWMVWGPEILLWDSEKEQHMMGEYCNTDIFGSWLQGKCQLQQYLGGYKIPLLFMYGFAFYVCLTFLSAIFLCTCILPEKKHLQVLDWSRPKAAFLSSHPTPSPRLSDTETALRFSRGTMKNSFHHSLFLMSLKKMSFWRRTQKKKAIYPEWFVPGCWKGKGSLA